MRIASLFLLFLFASVASAQITDMVVWDSADSGYVTTTWKKIQFPSGYYRISQMDIDHDTTNHGRTPKLQYAYDNDTTATKIFSLRPGDAIHLTGLGLQYLHIRASADSVPARVAIYR